MILFNVLLKVVLFKLFTTLFALIYVLRAPLLMGLDIAKLDAHAATQRALDVAIINQLLQAPVRLFAHREHFFAAGALLAR